MALPVVFDCMVFLQAAARRDSIAAACLELAEQGHLQLCLSREVLAEIGDVLQRPEIHDRFPSLTHERVTEFLEAVGRMGVLFPAVDHHFHFERDPKDEPYLNLAIQARAHYLASRDKDILDLQHGSDPAAVDFRARFPFVRIVDPLEFLQEIRQVLQPPRPREPGRER